MASNWFAKVHKGNNKLILFGLSIFHKDRQTDTKERDPMKFISQLFSNVNPLCRKQEGEAEIKETHLIKQKEKSHFVSVFNICGIPKRRCYQILKIHAEVGDMYIYKD